MSLWWCILVLFYILLSDYNKDFTILPVKFDSILNQIEPYKIEIVPICRDGIVRQIFKSYKNTQVFNFDVFVKYLKLLKQMTFPLFALSTVN